MSIQSIAPESGIAKPAGISGFHVAFVVAWFFCLPFYFVQYAVRSAPSVMLPELTSAFGLTTLGVRSLLGLYYYTIATPGRLAPVFPVDQKMRLRQRYS